MVDEALSAAVLEIERHVGRSGWDQPARLFALVSAAELRAAEPSLASQLPEGPSGSLACVEQEDFHAGDLGAALMQIGWPETVTGVAVSLERWLLAAADDSGLEPVAELPPAARDDVRLVVGVTRAGATFGVARIRSHESELVSADNLVPELTDALMATLRWSETQEK